ncbi:MAG: sulfotransferase [Proteobacteria bacterium]|nr:MAG: sulfotransferase [Pseudomonadota bacterium]
MRNSASPAASARHDAPDSRQDRTYETMGNNNRLTGHPHLPRYGISPKVEGIKVGDSIILEREGFEKIRINLSAASILSCCDEWITIPGIVERVRTSPGAAAVPDLNRQIVATLTKLKDAGIVDEKPPRVQNDWNAPLLISGCARSGTTALTRSLSTHSGFCLFNEFYLYGIRDAGTALWKRILDMKRNPPPPLVGESLEALKRDLHTELPLPASNTIMRNWLFSRADPCPRVYGDKLPGVYLMQMRKLARAMPQARFIVTLRDGRAVIASQLREFEVARRQNRPPQPWMTPSIAKAQEMWLRFARAWIPLRDDPPAPCLELRYESAIADPESMFRQVCDFIGVAFDRSEFAEALSLYRGVHVDAWKRECPDIDQHLSPEFHEALSHFGYE